MNTARSRGSASTSISISNDSWVDPAELEPDAKPPVLDPNVLPLNQAQYNMSIRPLWCIPNGKFRRWVIHIVDHKWFDRLILLVIVLNALDMAVDVPDVHNETVKDAVQYSEYCFLAIFIIEAILKAVGMGFVLHPYAYLRNGWNVLDFCIVVVGLLALLPQVANVTVIRLLRVLRPLRSVRRVPGLRVLAETIVVSLPMLLNVLLLLLFLMTIFAIIGFSLLSGSFHYRCYLEPGNWTGKFHLVLNDSRRCNPRKQGRDCPVGYCLRRDTVFTEDYLNFDNFLYAILTLFKLMPAEGWGDTQEMGQDSSGYWIFIYFCSAALVGKYFITNLCLTVLTSNYKKKQSEIKAKRYETESRESSNMDYLSPRSQRLRRGISAISGFSGISVQPPSDDGDPASRGRFGRGRQGSDADTEDTSEMSTSRTSGSSASDVEKVTSGSRLQLTANGLQQKGTGKSLDSYLDYCWSLYSYDIPLFYPWPPGCGPQPQTNTEPAHSATPPSHEPETPLNTQCPDSGVSDESDSLFYHPQKRPAISAPSSGADDEDTEDVSPGRRKRSGLRLQETPSGISGLAAYGSSLPNTPFPTFALIKPSPKGGHEKKTDGDSPSNSSTSSSSCVNVTGLAAGTVDPDRLMLPTDPDRGMTPPNSEDPPLTSRTQSSAHSGSNGGLPRRGSGEEGPSGASGMTPRSVFATAKTVSGDKLGGSANRMAKTGIDEDVDFPGHPALVPITFLRKRVRTLLSNRIAAWVPMLVTLVNLSFLCMDHYHISKNLADLIKTVNFICYLFFAAEAGLKLFAFGIVGYFKDPFNILDFVLIIVGIPEMIVSNRPVTSAFRIFRLARLVRLIKKLKSMSHLMGVILKSLMQTFFLYLLLALLVFMFTILGINLFYDKIANRLNFNSLWESALTVFMVVANQGWTAVMQEAMKATNPVACLFFIILFLVGQFLLVNLYLPILIYNCTEHRRISRAVSQVLHQRHFSIPYYDENEPEAQQQPRRSSRGARSSASGGSGPRQPDIYEIVARRPAPKSAGVHRFSLNLPRTASTTSWRKELANMQHERTPRQRRQVRFAPTPPISSSSRGTASARLSPSSRHRSGGSSNSLQVSVGSSGELLQASSSIASSTGSGSISSPLKGTKRKLSSPRLSNASELLRAPPRMWLDNKEDDEDAANGGNNSNQANSTNNNNNNAEAPDLSARSASSGGWSDQQLGSPTEAAAGSSWKDLAHPIPLRSIIKGKGRAPLRTTSDISLAERGDDDSSSSDSEEEESSDDDDDNDDDKGEGAEGSKKGKKIPRSESGIERRSASSRRRSSGRNGSGTVTVLEGINTGPNGEDTESIIESEGSESVSETGSQEDEISKLEGKSLNLFAPDNKFRVFLARIVLWKHFDWVVIAILVASVVFLALDDPTHDDNQPMQRAIDGANYGFLAFFIVEMFAKIIALGFFQGDRAYLKNIWNRSDFIIIMIAIPAAFVKQMRCFRAIRIVRIATRLVSIRVVLHAFIRTIPHMGNVVLVNLIVMVAFACVGVSLFKGKYYSCNDPMITDEANCTGLFLSCAFTPSRLFNKTIQLAANTTTVVTARSWFNTPFNFDNVGEGLFTLFVAQLGDGLPELIYNSIDARDEGQTSVRNYRPIASLYILAYFLVGNFFLINLFAALLIAKFERLNNEAENAVLMADSHERRANMSYKNRLQYQFVKKRKRLHLCLQRPEPFLVCGRRCALRRFLFDIITHPKMEYAIAFINLLNTVVLAMHYDGQSTGYGDGLRAANLTFIIIFTVEMVAKNIALGVRTYFRDDWNKFDAIIVLISWIGYATDNIAFSAVRIFRAGRILKLFHKARALEKMFQVCIFVLPTLLNVSLLILCFIFIFAYAGVQLFGTILMVPYAYPLNNVVSFHTVPEGLVTLIQAFTISGWTGMFKGTIITPSNSACTYEAGNCGERWISLIYFITFVGISGYLLANMFIAVVNESFAVAETNTDRKEELEAFRALWQKWSHYDPDRTEKMNAVRFINLTFNLPAPVGPKDYEVKNIKRALRYYKSMEVQCDQNGDVHYLDALSQAAKRAFSKARDYAFIIAEFDRAAEKRRKYDKATVWTQYTTRDIYAIVTIQLATLQWLRRRRIARMSAKALMEVPHGQSFKKLRAAPTTGRTAIVNTPSRGPVTNGPKGGVNIEIEPFIPIRDKDKDEPRLPTRTPRQFSLTSGSQRRWSWYDRRISLSSSQDAPVVKTRKLSFGWRSSVTNLVREEGGRGFL